jgi:hypothetical protein
MSTVNNNDYPYSTISKPDKKSNFSEEYLLSNISVFLFTRWKREEIRGTYLKYFLFSHTFPYPKKKKCPVHWNSRAMTYHQSRDVLQIHSLTIQCSQMASVFCLGLSSLEYAWPCIMTTFEQLPSKTLQAFKLLKYSQVKGICTLSIPRWLLSSENGVLERCLKYIIVFKLLSFFGGARIWTQNFTFAKKTFHCLSHTSSPRCCFLSVGWKP